MDLSLKMRLLKKFLYKKRKFWPVSDPDPNPGFAPGSKSGIRIRIRSRSWIRCFFDPWIKKLGIKFIPDLCWPDPDPK